MGEVMRWTGRLGPTRAGEVVARETSPAILETRAAAGRLVGDWRAPPSVPGERRRSSGSSRTGGIEPVDYYRGYEEHQVVDLIDPDKRKVVPRKAKRLSDWLKGFTSAPGRRA
jgi:hypothetical protein